MYVIVFTVSIFCIALYAKCPCRVVHYMQSGWTKRWKSSYTRRFTWSTQAVKFKLSMRFDRIHANTRTSTRSCPCPCPVLGFCHTKHRGMRWRHAISPGYSGLFQDVGIRSNGGHRMSVCGSYLSLDSRWRRSTTLLVAPLTTCSRSGPQTPCCRAARGLRGETTARDRPLCTLTLHTAHCTTHNGPPSLHTEQYTLS